MKRGGPIARRTPLRQRTRIQPVNRERKRKLYARQFGDYADLIRAMQCVVCDRGPSDPHHVRSRGAGGEKSSLVPMCRRCHALLHAMGRAPFEARFQVDLESEAAALWEGYGGD